MTETQATYGVGRADGRYAADFIEQQASEIKHLQLDLQIEKAFVVVKDAEIERLNERWAEWKESLNSVKEQRNALQAKLSAMESVEPVGFISPHDLQMLSEGYPRTVVMLAGAKHTEALYTAPKVIPLTDEQVEKIVDDHTTDDGGYDIWCNGRAVARAIEAAHNIGGQHPRPPSQSTV